MNILKPKYIPIILKLTMLLPAIAMAKTTDPKPIVDQFVNRFMTNKDVPGVAVALYYQGNTYYYNYGVANKSTKQPVTKDSIFEIGSITKVFTSTLLSLEVNSGAMKLDDKVVKFLPPKIAKDGNSINQVTLYELATHTSSLPPGPPNVSLSQRADYSKSDLMNFITNWQAQIPVGSTYKYSNIGYGLIGYALENATHKSYKELLYSMIFNPLRMSNSSLNNPVTYDNYVQGYDQNNNIAMHWLINAWPAGGAIRSTSSDMLQFLKANLGVIEVSQNPNLNKSMQYAQKGIFNTPNFTQGLGWEYRSKFNPPLITKNGGTAGFGSIIVLAPDKKAGIVILSNKFGNGNPPEPIAIKIMQKLTENQVSGSDKN